MSTKIEEIMLRHEKRHEEKLVERINAGLFSLRVTLKSSYP